MSKVKVKCEVMYCRTGKSPEMVETQCYASCRPACEPSCIDDEYALFTVQEIICGKVSLLTCLTVLCPFLQCFDAVGWAAGRASGL